ncbi:MAG: hypothetical protein ABIQ35_07095 [Verrucomicrobiota bacterium]
MPSPYLILSLLGAICLTCASALEPWHEGWSGGRNQSANILNALIGDSRRMFANHFFAKADAYFHSGYYPTIFDSQKREEESHMTHPEENPTESSHDDHHETKEDHGKQEAKEAGFLGEPKDWIDRFSRNFFPSQHSHLEKNGDEREILPWLRLSAELDPNRIETYTIASYWLRKRLGKTKEAEQFLREGLRANPDSYEIYFELGRIYSDDLKEPRMARNILEIALRKWEMQEKAGKKPNDLAYEEITGNLSKIAEGQGDLKQAIEYLKLLKEKSPQPAQIQATIHDLELKLQK